MNITIIGAGSVGTTIGANWRKSGHKITYGVRDPNDSKHQSIKAYAEVVSVLTAATLADVIVLAIPWGATEAVIREMGESVNGKILIDATNPFKPNLSGLTHSGNDSGGEQVARWAPNSKVVKAINCAFATVMANPEINGIRSTMLIAGDDDNALKTATQLTEDLGFQVQAMKGLENSRLIEMLGLTLVTLAFKQGLGPSFGFALLRKA